MNHWHHPANDVLVYDEPNRVIIEELAERRHAVIPSNLMQALVDVSPKAWADFASHWDRLTLDRHMADGGTYRFRRYGQFDTGPENQWIWLPHAAYEQPRYVNALNGGVKRYFDPLEDSFVAHSVLQALLRVLLDIVEGVDQRSSSWNVRLHPYRIMANSKERGHPTPEGLHRDGVDYIVSMMVRRQNIQGGITQITDANRQPLTTVTLNEPMQTMIADDSCTMHGVSAIRPANPQTAAFRDVLVVAFTRREMA